MLGVGIAFAEPIINVLELNLELRRIPASSGLFANEPGWEDSNL
jgi:hypothetical protein